MGKDSVYFQSTIISWANIGQVISYRKLYMHFSALQIYRAQIIEQYGNERFSLEIIGPHGV